MRDGGSARKIYNHLADTCGCFLGCSIECNTATTHCHRAKGCIRRPYSIRIRTHSQMITDPQKPYRSRIVQSYARVQASESHSPPRPDQPPQDVRGQILRTSRNILFDWLLFRETTGNWENFEFLIISRQHTPTHSTAQDIANQVQGRTEPVVGCGTG